MEQFPCFVQVEAKLRYLRGDVELEEAVDGAVDLEGLFVDLSQEAEAVDAVDHIDEGCNVLHLVALQVADEMPFDVGREDRLFGGDLLHLVLPEYPEAHVIEFQDGFRRVGFRYGDHFHVGRDGFQDAGQVLVHFHAADVSDKVRKNGFVRRR